MGECGHATATPPSYIVQVHRIEQPEIALYLESLEEFITMVVEVRLDLETAIALWPAPEPLLELSCGSVRDHGGLACESQSSGATELDRLSLDMVPGDRLSGMCSGRSEDDGLASQLREGRGPLERDHPP